MIGKHQILVNTADLANGDSIAAYLVDAAGTLLTSTNLGGKDRLDVITASEYAEDSAHISGDYGTFVMGVRNDAGTAFGADGDYVPLSIDANGNLRVIASIDFAGDYAEDSAHTTADIGLFNLAVRRDTRSSGVDTDGDYASFNVNASGELWVKDADVLTELLDQGTTLDSILADTATIDSNLASLVKLEDAAHSSGDAGIQSLTVRRDAAGSNASADGDYSSLLTWSEGSLKTVDIANEVILQQQIGVTSTAVQVPASNMANRRSLLLQNTGGTKLWIGSATVTTSGATAGIELPVGAFMELEVGPDIDVYAVRGGLGTTNLNVLELA